MFWFKFNRSLNKNNVLASKLSFTQSAVLHTNRVIHKSNVLHKNNVLAGPVQALFVACRIVLSMMPAEHAEGVFFYNGIQW